MFVAPFFWMFEVLNMLGYKRNEVKEWNKMVVMEI
jgi:uncharacterized membrane protein YGL010W